MNKDVPVWEKYALTIREACQYFHIVDAKMREIVDKNKEADFVVMLGNRALIKRRLFEQYLDQTNIL